MTLDLSSLETRLARWIGSRPWTVVIASLLLTGFSLYMTAFHLRLVSDRSELMNPASDFAKNWKAYKEDFHYRDVMVAVVEGPAAAEGAGASASAARRRMKEFAHRLCEKLRQDPGQFPEVIERIDPASMNGMGLLYLPEPELRALATRVKAAAPLLAGVFETGLEGMFQGLRDAIDKAGEGGGNGEKDAASSLAMLKSVSDALELAADGKAESAVDVFSSAFDGGSSEGLFRDPDGYIFFGGGRYLLIPVVPKVDREQLNQLRGPVHGLRAAIAGLHADYPELQAGVTGRAVVHSDEMESTSRDMNNGTIAGLIGVAIIFFILYRGKSRIVCAMLTLLMGMAWTYGFAAVSLGRLNLFAMVFAVVLVGQGPDFAVFFLTHFDAARADGHRGAEAVASAYARGVRGIVMGAVTTAVALFMAMLTEFSGLAELGLIGGMGLLLVLASMIMTYPALLVLLERYGALPPPAAPPAAAPAGAPAALRSTKHDAAVGALLASLIALSLLGYVVGAGQPFNYDILTLQPAGSESVHWEEVMIEKAHVSNYGISIAPHREELVQRAARFAQATDVVARVEGLFPDAEDAKREMLRDLGAALGDLPLAGEAHAPPAPGAGCKRALALLRQDFRNAMSRDERAVKALQRPFDVLTAMLERWDKAPTGTDGGPHLIEQLQRFQDQLLGFLRTKLSFLLRQCSPPPLTPESAPAFFRSRFLGEDGKLALFVYAREDIWEWQALNRYVAAVRAVDPEITGTPVTVLESSSSLHRSFEQSVLYALAAVAVVLWLNFRRAIPTCMALLPVPLGIGLLFGLMRLFGIELNFANCFAFPILIGTGLDCSVNVIHGYQQGIRRGMWRPILGTTLTTVWGFAPLMIAQHRGVMGLGDLLVLGSFLILGLQVWVLPKVLERIESWGWKV